MPGGIHRSNGVVKLGVILICLILTASCGANVNNQRTMLASEQNEPQDSPDDSVLEADQELANEPADEAAEQEIIGQVLAAIPDQAISLIAGTNGTILQAGDREQEYDWLYMTPRGIEPRLLLYDFDDDGVEELAISLYIGSGTGISISDLRMVELDGDAFADYRFDPEQYISQIHEATAVRTFMRDGELIAELTVASDVYTVSLKDYQGEEFGKVGERLIFGDIANFDFEDNQIKASFGVGISVESFVQPEYIGTLEANVAYEKGVFQLKDFQFKEYEV